jgi:hypothetical protein
MGVQISDFPSGVRFVLDRGRDRIRYMVNDPAGFGASISGLATCATVEEAVKRFDTAYSTARAAEALAIQGNLPEAFRKWRVLFGDYFPGYR